MPRFTIKRLMVVIGVVAGLLGLYRAIEPVQMLTLIQLVIFSLPSAGVAWLVVHRRPRRAAWAFAGLAATANGLVALVCAYLYSILGIILMVGVAILLISGALSAGSAWVLFRSPTRRMPNATAWILVLILGLLPISMMITRWPLRVAFALSRPAMEKLADRVAAGETLTAPEWVGLYRVVAAKRESRNGNVALIIDADPAGMSGFVRVATFPDTFGPMVNLNFNEPVGGPWFYQNED